VTPGKTPTRTDQQPLTEQPLVRLVCQILVAATLGLIVLPSVFADPINVGTTIVWPVRPEAAIWLAFGVVLGVWIVAISPRLARALSAPLGAAPWRGQRVNDVETRAQDAHFLAAVLVAVIGTALIVAILRRPLVGVTPTLAPPLEADAIVATASVVIILVLSLRLYLAARPFVEGSAWLALDSLIPTSGSEAATHFSDGLDVSTQPRPVSSAAPMTGRRVEPLPAIASSVLAAELDKTRLAGDSDHLDATIPAQAKAPDVITPDTTVAGDATIAAPTRDLSER
jgi:hypothetical protein